MTTTLKTYPKYKNTTTGWLPSIPFDWKINRGKFYFRNRKIINKTMSCDNVLSLTMNGVLHRSELGEGGLLPTSYDTFQIFEINNLVFKLIDLENYKTSRVGIVPEKGIMSSAYIRLEKKNDNLDPRYFYWLYFNFYLQGIYNFLGMGVRSTLNYWDLLEQPIIIPPLETQKNIADFLDAKIKIIDELVAKKEKMIELLHEKRAALITHAVTKGLDPKAKMKPSGIDWLGNIPDGWKVRRGKFLFRYKKELNDKYQCDHILALTLKGVVNKEDYEARSLVPTDYATYQIFYKDDLVFKLIDLENYQTSRVGLVPTKGIMSSAYLRITPKDKLISRYFYWLYYSLYLDGIYNFLGMGVRSTLNQWDLLSIFVQIPNISEQQQIADYLDTETNKIKGAIDLFESQIDQLKEYRSSLIYWVVTGKIKV